MGKSRRGEYSASNGRTSRSSHNYHHAPISEGLVAKVVLNTDALSGLERQKFTEEFTFEDGLSDSADLFKKDRNGNARQWARNHASVFHSLGKRGRWSLPELLKLDAHESCEESGRVTVVERLIHHDRSVQNRADCIAVTDSKAKVKVRTPRRKYSRFQDLKENSEEPELCYEFSYPYPTESWPNCAETSWSSKSWSRYWDLSNPKKAKCKNKGVRNKGERWGVYSSRDLKSFVKDDFPEFPPYCKRKKAKVEKVQVVKPKAFRNLKKTRETHQPRDSFELGAYLENLLAEESPTTAKLSVNKMAESPVKRFGKKSVIYVDAPASASEPEETSPCTPPVVFEPEPNLSTDINIINCDLEPCQLNQDWSEAYTEGSSSPRKFSIDITPILQSCYGDMNGQACHLLFKERKKVCSGVGQTLTSVNLITTSLEDSETPFEKIASDFCDRLQEKATTQSPWSVHDVVNLGILTCMKYITVTDGHHTRRNVPAPLKFLSEMFGWQSTPLSLTCAKTELKQTLDKSRATSQADATQFDYVCLPTSHCGICFQELDEEGE